MKRKNVIRVFQEQKSTRVTPSCEIFTPKFGGFPSVGSIMVDNGVAMGDEDKEFGEIPDLVADPKKIFAVVLTHCHADHYGLLPLMVRQGYNAPIYMLRQTYELLPAGLADSVKVLRSKGTALYDEGNVAKTLSLCKVVEPNTTVEVFEDSAGNYVGITLIPNAHIPGSASVMLEFGMYYADKVYILVTGDYSPYHPLLPHYSVPAWIKLTKLSEILVESTYGDTDSIEIHSNFDGDIKEAVERGGNILCPVLSLDRAELVLYRLRKMQDRGDIPTNIPIFIVGKLMLKFLATYKKGKKFGLTMDKDDFLPVNMAETTLDVVKSELQKNERQIIVLASPGMTPLGASLDLAQIIGEQDWNNLIEYTSYVPEGGVASQIINARRGSEITLKGGRSFQIKADVKQTEEFSAHARQDELLKFIKKFPNAQSIVITHGEPAVKVAFKKYLEAHEMHNIYIGTADKYLVVSSDGIKKECNSKLRVTSIRNKKERRKKNSKDKKVRKRK